MEADNKNIDSPQEEREKLLKQTLGTPGIITRQQQHRVLRAGVSLWTKWDTNCASRPACLIIPPD
ncbi:hypothetical protein CRUP_026279 [Coryphaenoides rupestris]|nr:hypothetical protein CRUP_026279 [Coryphaenoides rupestris]